MTPAALLDFLKSNRLCRTIVILLAVAFIALLAPNVTTFLMIRRVQSDNGWVSHTFEVRPSVQQLFNASLDEESAGRGYLITHDPSFLTLHQDAVDRTGDLLTVLERETTDNHAQQDRINRLRPLFRTRSAVLRAVIDAERRSDRAAVQAQ